MPRSHDKLRLARAGAPLPDLRQTFRAFVDSGDLGRALTRVCLLAETRGPLSFALERADDGGVRVALVVRGQPVAIACGPELLGEEAVKVLAANILREVNRALRAQGVAERLVVMDLSGKGGVYTGRRVFLVDGETAAWGASGSWEAAACLEPDEADRTDPGPRRPPRASGGKAPPALLAPSEVADGRSLFVESPSYPALLAQYVERLAAFAGVETVTCEPQEDPDDPAGRKSFGLRTIVRGKSGGSLQQTLIIRPDAPHGLQPIVDFVNGQLGGRGKRARRRAHLCARGPEGQPVILATAKAAAGLRRAAFLDEREPGAELLDRLDQAGFALPYLGGHWGAYARWQLPAVFTRMSLLARAQLALGLEVSRHTDGDDAQTIEMRAGGASATRAYASDLGKRAPLEVLTRVVADINDFVAAEGVAWRFVLFTAVPGHGHRVLWLAHAWWREAVGWDGTVVEGLGAGVDRRARPPWPARHPEEILTPNFPRLRRVDEIVPPRRVLESDFKSPARSEDYPDILGALARLAGLRVKVEPLALADALVRHYDVFVVAGGQRSTIRVENAKYPDVSPMLAYLNGLLEAGGRPRRLYRFTAGDFSSGVVLATAGEAARLREAAYIQS